MSFSTDVVTSVAPRLARVRVPLPAFVGTRLLTGLAEHQPDHRRLLTAVDVGAGAGRAGRLDAVVVPTCRPYEETLPRLRAVVDLARELGAVVVLLCSRRASAAGLPVELRRSDVPVLAIDITDWASTLPSFDTSGHAVSREQAWDTPDKRNLALLLAAALRWRTLMFLDDDLDLAPDGVCAQSVRGALGAFSRDPLLRLVGWRAEDFPDNSVVCHGRRLVGLPQTCFVGGGALLVKVEGANDLPFFPKVYNEDWLFVYAMLRHADGNPWRVGDAGTVSQAPYDPFRPDRARAEELGDVVAEGMFQLLGKGRRAESPVTDVGYWRQVVAGRHHMVGRIITALLARRPVSGPYLPGGSPAAVRGLRAAAVEALSEAQRTLGDAEARDEVAELVVDFIHAWRRDLRLWRKTLRRAKDRPEELFAAICRSGSVVANLPARTRMPLLGSGSTPGSSDADQSAADQSAADQSAAEQSAAEQFAADRKLVRSLT